jgi:hypothetical protein
VLVSTTTHTAPITGMFSVDSLTYNVVSGSATAESLEYSLATNEAINVTWDGSSPYTTAVNLSTPTATASTSIGMQYGSNDSTTPFVVTSTGTSTTTATTTFGFYIYRMSTSFVGSVKVVINQEDSILSWASGIWTYGTDYRPVIHFYGPVDLFVQTLYGNGAVFSHNSMVYFHDTVTSYTGARATMTNLRTESNGWMDFAENVYLHSQAHWRGDDVNAAYNDNVGSAMTFHKNLNILAESWSSSCRGIRSQGYLDVYGTLSITATGPRTVMGAALTHWRAVSHWYGPVSMTVIGANGRYGDVIGIQNDYGGQVYLYDSVSISVTTTGWSSSFGISSNGILQLKYETIGIEIFSTSDITGSTAPGAFGINTNQPMDLYSITASVRAWNKAAWTLNLYGSANMTVNCKSSAGSTHHVKLNGSVRCDTDTAAMCIRYNTAESFQVGNYFMRSSYFDIAFTGGSTWYFQDNLDSDDEQYAVSFNNGVFSISGANIDLAAYPATVTNITFPVKHLTIRSNFSLGSGASIVSLNNVAVRLRSDLEQSGKIDSIDMTHPNGTASEVTIYVVYDLVLNNTNSVRQRLSTQGFFVINLPQPLLVFKSPVLNGYHAGAYDYNADGLSLVLTPTLTFDGTSIWVTALQIGNPPNKSKSNAGKIAGGVVGGVLGAVLVAGCAVFLAKTGRLKALKDKLSSRP